MQLSENLKLEIKWHLKWLAGAVPAVAIPALFMYLPMFENYPFWAKIGLPAIPLVAYYAWCRQCLSPDKKTFTPRIWK